MPTRASRVRLMPLILAPPYREGVTDVTPWLRAFRTLHVTGLLLLLLAGPAHTPYAAAYEPVPAESRAGSRAGEGRERPGREATPTGEHSTPAHSDGPAGRQNPERQERQEQEASVGPEASRNPAPPSEPPPPARPARPADAHEAADRPVRASEPVLRVLPLGSGLVLIGLGLGLAFLGLRVRRN
ncbi:hypothetical protein GCM10017557_42620 [Streptomyces aurantiacus]|uniref:Uncharacterized protein n=1 Tax=Streptomyces aurantiacus TaxID=47760 RepID=A0A7G1P0W8_9ACTN|nr:hypothetical protein GCM10017557_42620 [Streptomyces aurantiacus]